MRNGPTASTGIKTQYKASSGGSSMGTRNDQPPGQVKYVSAAPNVATTPRT